MCNHICTIESLEDYVHKVSNIALNQNSWSSPSKLLFRGHSNKTYELVPALGRYPSTTWMNTWQYVETGLIQTAQQKFPMLFPATDYPAILLAKLQHYGIYTRMLDMTANAFVALYFACKNNNDLDGEVLAFSAQTVSAYNPIVNAIADTYRLTRNSMMDIRTYYFKVQKQPYYSSYLYPANTIQKEKNLLTIFIQAMKIPRFVEVGTVCERQKNQGGYFLLFPNKLCDMLKYDEKFIGPIEVPDERITCNESVTDELVTISKSDSMIVKKFIIPNNLKCEILEQLTHFGITDDFLFPDSIDEVCKGIVSEYRKHFP